VPLDPEEFLADWAHRAEQQTLLTAELSQRMQEMTAAAESPGGEAVVTVGSSGGLAELTLADHAMRKSPTDLAEIILSTSRLAQARLARRIADLATGLYGAESDTAAFIGGTYTAQFPEPAEDQERDRR
jgi:hypothetical protein